MHFARAGKRYMNLKTKERLVILFSSKYLVEIKGLEYFLCLFRFRLLREIGNTASWTGQKSVSGTLRIWSLGGISWRHPNFTSRTGPRDGGGWSASKRCKLPRFRGMDVSGPYAAQLRYAYIRGRLLRTSRHTATFNFQTWDTMLLGSQTDWRGASCTQAILSAPSEATQCNVTHAGGRPYFDMEWNLCYIHEISVTCTYQQRIQASVPGDLS